MSKYSKKQRLDYYPKLAKIPTMTALPNTGPHLVVKQTPCRRFQKIATSVNCKHCGMPKLSGYICQNANSEEQFDPRHIRRLKNMQALFAWDCGNMEPVTKDSPLIMKISKD
jgi:hypothetical protein